MSTSNPADRRPSGKYRNRTERKTIMLKLLKDICTHVRNTPQKIAIVDQGGERATSYAELMDMSARLASRLLKQGLGREKIFVIRVPRGVQYVACRLAAMMIGAAWIGVEEMMGAERIEFIIKDCGAMLTVDEAAFREAMEEEPLPADRWADPDPHDLAFLYYTSGSTGKAKGVLEEYGTYEYMVASTWRAICRYVPLTYANIAPEAFIGGIYLMCGILSTGNTLHLIPLPLVRNPAGLLEYFQKHHVEGTCMPPTLVKALEHAGGMNLKVLHVTGEVAVDLYFDHYPMMNAYGPTEFSYLPFFFDIDKPYKNTPIGTPDENTQMVLLDENGRKNPNEGVLHIRLPYFRGYLHDQNRDCFVPVDGVPYFRTGDYLVKDERGNYTLLGRVDDMVKINGNRIEPAEVEFAVREVLHTDFAAVRAWERGGSRYLCAYHKTGRKLDPAEMAEKLRTRLPLYMIPSCYMAIDEIPLNNSGKVNKLALPEPDEDLLFAPYADPEDSLQQKLRDAFAGVLDVHGRRIGIDDDFFLLGGDSLRAIEVVTACGLPGLTVPAIYEGRTVRRIAGLLRAAADEPEQAPETPAWVPLNAGQRYLLEADLKYPGTCMLNLPFRFNLLPEADPEKIAAAVRTAVQAHPALTGTIERQNGEWILRYRPERSVSVPVEQMTDEALEKEAAAFVRPFTLNGEPLFRCRVIRGESKKIVLLDVYHVICDGFSGMKLVADIGAAFAGLAPGADRTYQLMLEEAESRSSERFREDMEYFASRYDRPGWDTCLKPDHESGGNTNAQLFLPFPFTRQEAAVPEKKYGLGKGGLYLAAAALALAACNDSENILFTWTWHGRSDSRRMASVGHFMKDLPIGLCLKRELSLARLFEEIGRQVSGAVSHGSVSYWEEKGSYYGKDLLCFLYQGDLYDIPESGEIVSSVENLPRPGAAGNNSLDVEILDGRDAFGVRLNYNAEKYDLGSVERFAECIRGFAAKMLKLDPGTASVADVLS